MPLVHIEHTVGRGSLRQRVFRLLPDLWSRLSDLEVCTWNSCVGSCVRREVQSGAVLSSGAEADTLCASRVSVRGDSEARRAQEECDVGPHFLPSPSQCADAGLWQGPVWGVFFFFKGSLAVLVGIKITASFWTLRRVCPLTALRLPLSSPPLSDVV